MTTKLLVGFVLTVQVGLVQLRNYDVDEHSSGDPLGVNSACPHNCVPQKGEIGRPGPDNTQGDDGDMGKRGDPGRYPPWFHWHTFRTKGAKGERGTSGSDGRQGIKGTKGSSGQSGSPGLAGLPGPDGEIGMNGDVGPKGIRGILGTKGDRGQPGTKGFKGDMGGQGPKGEDGEDGGDANRGPTGDAGVPGDDGQPGPQGRQGSKGEQGDPGEIGTGGFSGIVGNSGQPGEDGKRGERGEKGPLGDKGEPGEKGSHGDPIKSVAIGTEPCTEENEGRIYYDPGTNVVYFCDGQSWQCTSGRRCDLKCVNPKTNRPLDEDEVIFDIRTERATRNRPAGDIVILVDDSQTMRDEHEWINNATLNLERVLKLGGVGVSPDLPNLYSIVSFGGAETHVVKVNGQSMYKASDVQAAIGKLTLSGDEEDGYHAVQVALETLPLRNKLDPSRFALNVVMITDEPRTKALKTNKTEDDILQMLIDARARFNLIANIKFQRGSGATYGVDYRGYFYYAIDRGNETVGVFDSNGFRTGNVGVARDSDPEKPWCTAYKDYGRLALDTRGAIWDLQVLRNSANTNDRNSLLQGISFNNAVVRVKAQEVLETAVCRRCVCKDVGKLNTAELKCEAVEDENYCNCRAGGRTDTQCKQPQLPNLTSEADGRLPWTELYKICDQ
ncbi:uncharacterized protein LOC134196167 [Corticium candelabrum]|uniref:uncharacterized protein LOC134196167 n=1 Tax=Corticium candelabrum TaxID=121492 RepID=UPI002E2681B9|nr:uncharacterized protein LOC134196167 [Corticium candelabrum]